MNVAIIDDDAKMAANKVAIQSIEQFGVEEAIEHHAKLSRIHLEILAAIYRVMPNPSPSPRGGGGVR